MTWHRVIVEVLRPNKMTIWQLEEIILTDREDVWRTIVSSNSAFIGINGSARTAILHAYQWLLELLCEYRARIPQWGDRQEAVHVVLGRKLGL